MPLILLATAFDRFSTPSRSFYMLIRKRNFKHIMNP